VQSYSEPPWHDRLARAEAYLPDDASAAYLAAAEGDWRIWRVVLDSLAASDGRELEITDEFVTDPRPSVQRPGTSASWLAVMY
jgi:hypothetical protein